MPFKKNLLKLKNKIVLLKLLNKYIILSLF